MSHWNNIHFAPFPLIVVLTGPYLRICNVNSLPLFTNVAPEQHMQFICVWSGFYYYSNEERGIKFQPA